MGKKGNVTPKGEDVAGTTQDEGLTAHLEVVSDDSQPTAEAIAEPVEAGVEPEPEQAPEPEPELEVKEYVIPASIDSESEAMAYVSHVLPSLSDQVIIVTTDKNIFTKENFSLGHNHAAKYNLQIFRIKV